LRKKTGILLVSLGVIALGAVLWKFLPLDEPWCRCRPLSVWLTRYGAGPQDYRPSPEADEALRRIGPKAVPYLLNLLEKRDSDSRITVPHDLIITSAPPLKKPTVLARLETWVENNTPLRLYRARVPASWGHWKAYVAFQKLGPLGKSALPALAKLAHDPAASHYPGTQGARNLGLMAALAKNSYSYVSPAETNFVPANGIYFGHLPDPKPFLLDGEIAAWSLSAIGAEAVPALVELLGDSDPHLRARAAEALALIGPAAEPAVPLLAERLHDADPEVSMRAADALGWIGKQPTVAIQALIKSLKDDGPVGLQTYAADSLGRFGEQASNAIPELLANFVARDYRIRQRAALALSKISPEITVSKVMPVLLGELKDSRADFRNTALLTLLQIHEEPELAIPAVIEAIDDSDRMVQGNAVRSIGRFGPAAKAAVPKLIRLTNDPDRALSQLAIESLKKIDRN